MSPAELAVSHPFGGPRMRRRRRARSSNFPWAERVTWVTLSTSPVVPPARDERRRPGSRLPPSNDGGPSRRRRDPSTTTSARVCDGSSTRRVATRAPQRPNGAAGDVHDQPSSAGCRSSRDPRGEPGRRITYDNSAAWPRDRGRSEHITATSRRSSRPGARLSRDLVSSSATREETWHRGALSVTSGRWMRPPS